MQKERGNILTSFPSANSCNGGEGGDGPVHPLQGGIQLLDTAPGAIILASCCGAPLRFGKKNSCAAWLFRNSLAQAWPPASRPPAYCWGTHSPWEGLATEGHSHAARGMRRRWAGRGQRLRGVAWREHPGAASWKGGQHSGEGLSGDGDPNRHR